MSLFLGSVFFASKTHAAATVILFSDGFESGDFSQWNEVNEQFKAVRYAPGAYAGTYRVDISGTTTPENRLVKEVDVSGYEALGVSFWYKMPESKGFEAADTISFEYTIDGNSWETLRTFGDGDETNNWVLETFSLPETADSAAAFGIRFTGNADAANDVFSIDEVLVTGIELVESDPEGTVNTKETAYENITEMVMICHAHDELREEYEQIGTSIAAVIDGTCAN